MIGETLKCIRTANEDMKLKDVAEKTGYYSSYISELETGKKKPSLKSLRKLSELYDMPLSKIMELDEYNDECTDLSFQRTLIKVLEYYIEKSNSKDGTQKQKVKNKKG